MYQPADVQKFFTNSIDPIALPLIDTTPHMSLLSTYVTPLNTFDTITGAYTLTNIVVSYPQAARTAHFARNWQSELTTEQHLWKKFVHSYLREYEGLVFVAVKQRSFQRSNHPPQVDDSQREGDVNILADAVLSEAVAFPYITAIHFLSALSGAWILTHPVLHIQQYDGLQSYFGQRTTIDDAYIFMLSSLLIEHGTAWMR